MGISYADVLIGIALTLLVGLLLVGSVQEVHRTSIYMKERNVAFTIMYEQLYNAPWYSETATTFSVLADSQRYTVKRTVTRGCASLGPSAVVVPFCADDFKETTVTVLWKDHTLTGTRISRVLP
jgi:hypothetical protein